MGKTKISWTDETANWIVDGKGNWNGNIEFVPKVLDGLLKGKRSRRVFAPSMSDPFHPNVKDKWLDQFMATVALTPHITYQLLTKRPERMLEYLARFNGIKLKQCLMLLRMNGSGVPEPRYSKINNELQILENLHIGVTVENQAAADERIPLLLQMPATVRFLSVEPLLEEIHLTEYLSGVDYAPDSLGHEATDEGPNLVIIGGESGSNARPFHLEWARSLIDQCREAGTKVFMKQVGSNAFYEGQPYKTWSRAGTDPIEWPEWMRIQEFV